MKESLTVSENLIKRCTDLLLATTLLTFTWWIILLAWILASIDTRSNGMFAQRRIGRWGRPFTIIKIKTMRPTAGLTTTVTAAHDLRITPMGRIFRRTKIDELPQLLNVLLGQMSFVGPRPDVPGYADLLQGEDRMILNIRPGLTGPATLAFRNEEILLAKQDDAETFNQTVIFPRKVELNKEYIHNYAYWRDFVYIFKTILH